MSKIKFTDSWRTYIWFISACLGLLVAVVWNPIILQVVMLLGMFWFLVMVFEANIEYLLLKPLKIKIKVDDNSKRAVVYFIAVLFTILVFVVGSGIL